MDDKQVVLNFSVDQLNTILNGVGQLPYMQAAPIIGYIQQIAEQQLGKEGGGEDTEKSANAA